MAERTPRTLRATPMTSTPTPDREALRKAASDRIAIEAVSPEIDGGRFPARRAVDDVMVVEADVFCDGHDKIDAALRYRCENEEGWHDVPMQFLGNDRWRAEFPLTDNARYLYTIVAWRDLYATWCDEVGKKHGAGQTISLELIEARHLIEETITVSYTHLRAHETDSY